MKNEREHAMASHDLKLFILGYCPYCHKVTSFMERRGIEVPTVDITTDTEAEAELISVGGKRQCPCLLIDGTPLYESSDIIAWMKENLLES